MGQLVINKPNCIEPKVIDLCEGKVDEISTINDLLGSSLDMEVIHDQIIESYWEYRSKVNYWLMRSNIVRDYELSHETVFVKRVVA